MWAVALALLRQVFVAEALNLGCDLNLYERVVTRQPVSWILLVLHIRLVWREAHEVIKSGMSLMSFICIRSTRDELEQWNCLQLAFPRLVVFDHRFLRCYQGIIQIQHFCLQWYFGHWRLALAALCLLLGHV